MTVSNGLARLLLRPKLSTRNTVRSFPITPATSVPVRSRDKPDMVGYEARIGTSVALLTLLQQRVGVDGVDEGSCVDDGLPIDTSLLGLAADSSYVLVALLAGSRKDAWNVLMAGSSLDAFDIRTLMVRTVTVPPDALPPRR